MISDVLSDAQTDIVKYLNDPLYSDTYNEYNGINNILYVLAQMDTLRAMLDNPDGFELPDGYDNQILKDQLNA